MMSPCVFSVSVQSIFLVLGRTIGCVLHFVNSEVQMRSSLECVESLVLKADITCGFIRNVIFCSLLEQTGKTRERECMVCVSVIRVNGNLFKDNTGL